MKQRSEAVDYTGFVFCNLIVYWYLKTFIFMAKFELKFIDCVESSYFIQTEVINSDTDLGKVITIFGQSEGDEFAIWLDKSTAIKFAKTLRTEINKITESEVKNA